jgi:hypothetical protein
MKKVLPLLYLCLSILACKKNTTIIVEPAKLPESYMPDKQGSLWKYSLSGIVNGSKQVLATGRDTVFTDYPNYTFKILDAGSFGYEYSCKQGNDYYITVPYSATSKPYLVIKDAAAIGETWIGAINGTDTYKVQLLEKNISHEVNNVNFEKVLHIRQTRIDKNNDKTMDLDTWVAYHYGVVHTEGSVSGFPYTSKVTSVEVK